MLWLRLNRPEALNTLSDALIEELDDAIDEIEADPKIRVVVVTGAGRAFCAGGDLKGFTPTGELDPDALMRSVRRAASVVERIPLLDKPVIAAVNGVAVGGGLELMLACDFVVAARGARIGDCHLNYGVLPGGGAAARLPRLVGPSLAKRLTFTGELLPAAEFLPYGLVTEVVADDELTSRVGELAAQIAAKSPLGLARVKRLIDDGLDQSLATALRSEHEALWAHAHSADMREGLAAFKEKRTPQYTGR